MDYYTRSYALACIVLVLVHAKCLVTSHEGFHRKIYREVSDQSKMFSKENREGTQVIDVSL